MLERFAGLVTNVHGSEPRVHVRGGVLGDSGGFIEFIMKIMKTHSLKHHLKRRDAFSRRPVCYLPSFLIATAWLSSCARSRSSN
jgi:hypothetical protein